MSGRVAWDRLYAQDGRPWKGGTDERLPLKGTVLELGVGNGKGIDSLPSEAHAIGLDFSRQALLSCRRWQNVRLVQGDVTALPFREGSVPSISASHILGHLTLNGRRQAAREIHRVLMEGGSLYVNVFGEQDMRCGKGLEMEERSYERGNGIICHYFKEGEVTSLFPGLTVEREWERRLTKRFHGRDVVRQELRALLRK